MVYVGFKLAKNNMCSFFCCIFAALHAFAAGKVRLSCLPKVADRDTDHPREGSDMGADAVVRSQCE